jgi:hypothetical protein
LALAKFDTLAQPGVVVIGVSVLRTAEVLGCETPRSCSWATFSETEVVIWTQPPQAKPKFIQRQFSQIEVPLGEPPDRVLTHRWAAERLALARGIVGGGQLSTHNGMKSRLL